MKVIESGYPEDLQPVGQKEPKKNREMSDESLRGSMACLCLLVAVMVFGIITCVPEKTQGVVVKRDKNLLYVKNLQDTSKYVSISNDLIIRPYGIKAFPYVNVGDTLDYGTHATSAVNFNQVKRINSKKFADFVKERKKMQLNALNQNTNSR